MNCTFETEPFLASRLRFWRLSVLFTFLYLSFFEEHPKRMQVLHQSYLAIFLNRQKKNLLRNFNLSKNTEVRHSLGKWPCLGGSTSTKWFFVYPIPDQIGIWKCWFLRRGENRRTRRNNLRSGVIFFASLFLLLEREKIKAWYIHLTIR